MLTLDRAQVTAVLDLPERPSGNWITSVFSQLTVHVTNYDFFGEVEIRQTNVFEFLQMENFACVLFVQFSSNSRTDAPGKWRHPDGVVDEGSRVLQVVGHEIAEVARRLSEPLIRHVEHSHAAADKDQTHNANHWREGPRSVYHSQSQFSLKSLVHRSATNLHHSGPWISTQ